MAIEKDVTIRLKIPKAGRDGQAFEDAAKRARDLEKYAGTAGAAVRRLMDEMRTDQRAAQHVERITDGLKRMGVEAKAAGDAARRLLKDVADGAMVGDREISKLARGLTRMGHAEARGPTSMDQLRQMGRDIPGALASRLSAASLPMAVVGAASQGIGIARDATHPEEGLTGRRFFEQLVRKSEEIRIFGNLFGMSNEAQALKERDRQLADSRNRIPFTQQRQATLNEAAAQRRSVSEEMATSAGDALDYAKLHQRTFAQEREFQGESERAQDAARLAGRDPREVAAQFAFRQGQAGLTASQAVDRQQLGEVLKVRQGEAGKARTELDEARKGAAGLASARPNETGEQAELRRLKYAEQLVVVQAKEAQLQQTTNALLAAQKQQQTQLVQQSQQRVQLMQQERGRLTGVIAGEKEKLRGEQIGFGHLTNEEQERAIRLGKRANAGGRLNRDELDFLGGIQGTEKITDKQYMERGAKNFGAFAETFGRNEKLKEAEQQRTQIENNIKVELDLNAQSVADQLTKTLMPQLMQALADLKQATNTKFAQQSNEKRMQDANQTR